MERLKTTITSPSFSIGTNLEVNLNERKGQTRCKVQRGRNGKTDPDVKPKWKELVKTKPNIEFKKEDKQDVKMIKTEPGMDKITYEEVKVALVLGVTCLYSMVDVQMTYLLLVFVMKYA